LSPYLPWLRERKSTDDRHARLPRESWPASHFNLIRKMKLVPGSPRENVQVREPSSCKERILTEKCLAIISSDSYHHTADFKIVIGGQNGRAERKERLFGKRHNISSRIRRLHRYILFQMRRWGMGNVSFDRRFDRPVRSLVESVKAKALTLAKALSGLFSLGLFFKDNYAAPA